MHEYFTLTLRQSALDLEKYLTFLALYILVACNGSQYNAEQGAQENNPNIEFKTFNSEIGWGYDIFVDSKKYVHQQHIPAITGNKGFKSEEDAKKTARLVSDKILRNITPPSVTANELDSLGVDY